jgi:hypothetical protein
MSFLRENLKDAGLITQTILTQPVTVPGVSDELSLLEAAQQFNPNDPENSALSKILLSFLQYPEPTQIMVRELEILSRELET